MAGMAKKILKGAGKVLTRPNSVETGGLSAHIIRRTASPLAIGLVVGGMTAVNVGKAGLSLHNNASLGQVTWQGTAARMTSNYESNGALKMTSGATTAIRSAAQSGNYELAQEMVEQTIKSTGIGGAIENYGVTPKFVSALYGMGG